MSIIQKIKWFRRKLSWNKNFKNGKWDHIGNEHLRYNEVVNLIKDTQIKNLKILDLGCGYGTLNHHLTKIEYDLCIGIDWSSNAIERAKKENFKNSTFIVHDIQNYKPNQKFDVIIFNEVLYYLDNKISVIENYVPFLKDDGYFLFSFYRIRKDLIDEINKKYELVRFSNVKQEENLFWGVCLFKSPPAKT
jgi:2-polyprenyl-3-methyl-5-hydroxy-6-metoxy-1,4-benzoquinol methylase